MLLFSPLNSISPRCAICCYPSFVIDINPFVSCKLVISSAITNELRVKYALRKMQAKKCFGTLRKHSLHEKTAASVLLKLFIDNIRRDKDERIHRSFYNDIVFSGPLSMKMELSGRFYNQNRCFYFYAPRKISGEHIVVALSVRPSVRTSHSCPAHNFVI